jgi:hypothetical protein
MTLAAVSYFHSHGLRAAVLNFVRPGYLLSEQDFTNEFVDPINKGRNKDASDGMVTLTLASTLLAFALADMMFVARNACLRHAFHELAVVNLQCGSLLTGHS